MMVSAVTGNATSAEELYESAMMHLAQGDKPAAVVQLQQALLLKPTYVEAWNNRGAILLLMGHPFDSLLHFEKAIALDPERPDSYNNRAAAYANMLMLREAIEDCSRALYRNPKLMKALINRANYLRYLGDPDSAIRDYRKAIEIDPKSGEAHMFMSLLLLAQGKLKEGWEEFEWRWQSGQMPSRGLSMPQWRGEPLDGKKLLIYAEQGFGDTLQFVRYASEVKRLCGGTVYIEVRPGVVRLFQQLIDPKSGIDKIFSFGEQLPNDIDYCIPMMSVPGVLGIAAVEDIEWRGPYLKAEPTRAKIWKEHVEQLPPGLRVGVCWAGLNRINQPIASSIDSRRSMTLTTMAPLGLVPGVGWVSLQKGAPADQIKAPPRGMTIFDGSEQMDDFFDTAALIDCVDLVITVDTSVVHLAGAMGKPTWLLSRWDNCWRWFGHREDSPWYPSVRQFVQSPDGTWDVMMEVVADELRKFVRQAATKAA